MVNWITKYIKPKLKSIFKKRSAEMMKLYGKIVLALNLH